MAVEQQNPRDRMLTRSAAKGLPPGSRPPMLALPEKGNLRAFSAKVASSILGAGSDKAAFGSKLQAGGSILDALHNKKASAAAPSKASAAAAAQAAPFGTSNPASAAPSQQPQRSASAPRLGGSRLLAPTAASAAYAAASPYKSLAQRVTEFQNKTPARFRGKASPAAAAGNSADGSAPRQQQPHITDAKTPNLSTRARARPSQFKPREERELEELAAMPFVHGERHLGRAAAGAGPSAANRLPPGGITETAPFNFVSDDRAEARRARQQAAAGSSSSAGAAGGHASDDEQQNHLFRAAPLRKSILDGPTWQPAKVPHQPTVPQSPMLRTKRRHTSHQPPLQALQEEAGPKFEFHARPVPNFLRLPMSEVLGSDGAHHQAPPTQPQPFRLATDQRHAKHEAELKAKLEAEAAAQRAAAERERRKRGRSLPSSMEGPLPSFLSRPPSRELTMPAPFNLASEQRHQAYSQAFTRRLAQEEEARKAAAQVKAQPVLHVAKPFQPAESSAPLTVPEPPRFRLESRLAQRAEFDARQEARLREEEERKRMAEAERQAQEEAERQEARKRARFEARPMPNFSKAPAMPERSTKPLTQPITPAFLKRAASRVRPSEQQQ